MKRAKGSKSGGFKCAPQRRHSVTPKVMANLVLQAPKRAESRHGNQCMTTWDQDTCDFTEGEDVILHVLYDIGRHDEVEARVLKWKGANVPATHEPKSLSGTVPNSLLAEIESCDPTIAELRQHAKIRPRARPDIKNASIARKMESGNFAAKKAATAYKPPMGLLNFCLDRISCHIHRNLVSVKDWADDTLD